MKTIPKTLYKSLLFSLIVCISGGISSCKSHKKNIVDDTTEYIGEQIVLSGRNKGKHNKIGNKIAEASLSWIGTPYGYGCCEKGVATDCSGMVIILYEEIADIKLPRNSAEQADFCDKLKQKDIQPGDLVFFATGKDKKKVSHVGVMIDACKFVHASASKGVILSEMTTPYYQRTFIKYGRVPGVK